MIFNLLKGYSIFLVAFFCLFTCSAIAQALGEGFGGVLEGEFLSGGGLGFIVGLAISLYGIYVWVVKQEALWGITALVGGIIITLMGDIYTDGLQPGMTAVLQAIGARS